MAHAPKLFVRDSHLDAAYLIVSDISQWDDALPVFNHKLFIQMPGFAKATEVLVTLKGTTAYSSHSLGLSTGRMLYDLPDGLYVLTLSAAPNDKVYTVVYHYRTALLEQQLYGAIAALATMQDPHQLDNSGNVRLTKLENVYTKALLILHGLRASMVLGADLVTANEQYAEIQRLLNQTKEVY